jgi:hypothetical protein
MALHHNPRIVTSGLVLALDAGDVNSYPGSGTTWLDLSGNKSNALFVGAPTYDSVTKSFYFDGTDDRFVAEITTPFDLYCLEIAFKPHKEIAPNVFPVGSDYSLLGIRSAAGNNNAINVYEWTGGMTNETVSIWSHDGFATGITTTVTLAFHIMFFNWNGSTYDIWLDGEKQSTIQRSTGHARLITGVSYVDPGYSVGYNYYHSGNIATVKAYNRALSATEIQQNYNSIKGRFGL